MVHVSPIKSWLDKLMHYSEWTISLIIIGFHGSYIPNDAVLGSVSCINKTVCFSPTRKLEVCTSPILHWHMYTWCIYIWFIYVYIYIFYTKNHTRIYIYINILYNTYIYNIYVNNLHTYMYMNWNDVLLTFIATQQLQFQIPSCSVTPRKDVSSGMGRYDESK